MARRKPRASDEGENRDDRRSAKPRDDDRNLRDPGDDSLFAEKIRNAARNRSERDDGDDSLFEDKSKSFGKSRNEDREDRDERSFGQRDDRREEKAGEKDRDRPAADHTKDEPEEKRGWFGKARDADEAEDKAADKGRNWFGKARDDKKEEPRLRDDDKDDERLWRKGEKAERKAENDERRDDRLSARARDDDDRDDRSDRKSFRDDDDHRDHGHERSLRDDARRFVGDERGEGFRSRSRAATVVDADFEDIDRDDDGDESGERGFGRRVRAERRRATALARLDDLDPVAERVFNDEFFTALRVQPKELERALRKARRRAEAREKNRMTPLRALGWSAWIGAVTATVFVGYAYRDDIVALWPNAAGAYAVVGIEANPHGLRIERVNHRLAMSTNGPTIEITGSLKNDGENSLATPLMQAEALGPKGELLSRWTFRMDAVQVPSGASAEFMTRAPAPEGVVEVALSFAPETNSPSIGELLKKTND